MIFQCAIICVEGIVGALSLYTSEGMIFWQSVLTILKNQTMTQENKPKVKCIAAIPQGYDMRAVTIGKEYEVVGKHHNDYKLIDDNGDIYFYPHQCFEPTPSSPIDVEQGKDGNSGSRVEQ